MPALTILSSSQVGAIALAVVGAVLFGLAAVRQHGAVHQHGEVRQNPGRARLTLREQLDAALRLARQPAWLVGAGQAGLGGALHVVALALAPITLVQPIGVIAVPVTVVAAAVRRRQRPRRSQVLGSLLSVAGIGALTVFLLRSASGQANLPGWVTLAATVAVILGAGVATTLAGGRGRPLVRCVSLAVTAAVLFGLNSILIRTIGAVVVSPTTSSRLPLLVTALVGIVAGLPLGVWAMQRAYVSGSPQVVICCLTLMDPFAAVVGGRLLLHDGGAITGLTLVGVIVCALVASGGVLLLSADYPADEGAASPERVARIAAMEPPERC
ncbi:MAG: DMT family transporter [Propionibacteriaceae bacterium]